MINLEFLDPHSAAKEFSSSRYLACMNQDELRVRLSYFYDPKMLKGTSNLRERLLNLYLNSFKTFDSEEMTSLQVHFSFLREQIASKGGKPFFLPEKQSIKLIKLDDRDRRLDWGYLYTINDVIVISTTFLEGFVNGAVKYQRSLESLGAPSTGARPVTGNQTHLLSGANDLYHEMLHLMQRGGSNRSLGFGPGSVGNFYSQFFETMYREYWGFQSVNPAQIKGKKSFRDLYTPITNPDGGNFEYLVDLVINGRHQTVTPVLVYDYQKRRPVTILVALEKDQRHPQSVECYRLTKTVFEIGDYRVQSYLERFPSCLSQLDHPHEISAQVISNYLILDQIDDNDWTKFPFYQYLNRFLHTYR